MWNSQQQKEKDNMATVSTSTPDFSWLSTPTTSFNVTAPTSPPISIIVSVPVTTTAQIIVGLTGQTPHEILKNFGLEDAGYKKMFKEACIKNLKLEEYVCSCMTDYISQSMYNTAGMRANPEKVLEALEYSADYCMQYPFMGSYE